ncbi:hypothetical protein KC19_5G119600 [Ceratodon purpureus]|uniref:Uncharacterized protein n=1 Tax=Ceratodon purpureus TaxID=3225 RepID=A0A8T0I1N9_CERPU|nr:hypothetical protein KC19_5G119600 [Ceratodon purpureus]
MSSIEPSSSTMSTMTDVGCVSLNEIFDISNSSTTADAARYSNREELPSERIEMIPVSLPNRQLSAKDWKILETNLLANGLVPSVKTESEVYVSGYLPRDNYNIQKEVGAMMMKNQ